MILALEYLEILCSLQGIQYRVEDAGQTLRIGAGTIVIPRKERVFGDENPGLLTAVAKVYGVQTTQETAQGAKP